MSDSSNHLPSALELRSYAGALLRETEAQPKADRTMDLRNAWLAGQVTLDIKACAVEEPGIPGRPAKPLLVAPREVGRRSMVTIEGRAALIHALAHIEFNAINLALDAVWRFADMPLDYYADW